jgi:hypothetical protein
MACAASFLILLVIVTNSGSPSTAAPPLAAAEAASPLPAQPASCCAGRFVSEGHGGVYPPGPEFKAFNFVASNDGLRFAQRAVDPGVQMGSIYINGEGHWYWTNATNWCDQPPQASGLVSAEVQGSGPAAMC